MATSATHAAVPRRGFWLWPYRPSRAVSNAALRWANRIGRIFDRTTWWMTAAVLIGAVPAGTAFLCGVPFAHLLTAFLLAPLLAAAAVRDATLRAFGLLALTVASQSAVNVSLAVHHPERLAVVLPAGERYWNESRHWIETGENPEYELSSWLPAHVQLFGGITLLSYVSFGITPLWRGLEQVDMMNFYVGRLIAQSESPWIAGVFGWHPWSVARGVGCLILLFEVVSLSFARLTGRRLSTARRRLIRWSTGIAFLVLDGIVKFTCMEPVRALLADNLPA